MTPEEEIDAVLDKIDVLYSFTTEEDFDPYHGRFELYKTDYCTFEVLDGGVWYKVDAAHPYPACYKRAGADIPDAVVNRVYECLKGVGSSGPDGEELPYDADLTPYYEAELRKEFDGVRFVDCNIMWDAVY